MMRRLITKNGKQVYTWDENEKSDQQLAAEATAVTPTSVVQTVVNEVAKVVEDVVEIAKVAVPTEKFSYNSDKVEVAETPLLIPSVTTSGSGEKTTDTL
jgi:hypothetical protein